MEIEAKLELAMVEAKVETRTLNKNYKVPMKVNLPKRLTSETTPCYQVRKFSKFRLTSLTSEMKW